MHPHRLAYSANKHGWTAQAFHSRVNTLGAGVRKDSSSPKGCYVHQACLLDVHGAASSAAFGGAAGKVATESLQRHQHTFLYADRGGDNRRGRNLRRLQSSGVGWARGRSRLYRGVPIHVARWRHPHGSHQARKGGTAAQTLKFQVKMCIDAFLSTWPDAYT